MKCTDWRLNTVKVLGIRFLYYKKIEDDENFLNQITSIEKILKLWGIRNLISEVKITVFKSLAMPKIVHIALITNINYEMIKQNTKTINSEKQ